MILLFNALEDGWTIKKEGKLCIHKKHNNEREIYLVLS